MASLLVTVSSLADVARAWWQGFVDALPALAAGVVMFALFYTAGRVVGSSARRALVRAMQNDRAAHAYATMVHYAVVVLGLVAGLTVAGVDFGAMMVAVGAVAFGITFAMQDAIANLVAGLILLTTHPFSRGDGVEVAGVGGTVEDVGIRATRLRTWDGLRVEVPNKSVLNSNITVYTYHTERRVDVPVSIGYDDDVPAAADALLKAAGAVEGVKAEPAPQVLVNGLGANGVDLVVRAWVDTTVAGPLDAKTEVARRAKDALQAGGFDIPYPTRTVRVTGGLPGGRGGAPGPAADPEPGR